MTAEGVGTWLRGWSRLRPADTALRFDDLALTWSDLEQRADAVAAALAELGVGRGDRVGCLLSNCPEFLDTVHAAALLGAIFVPLNVRLAPPELRFVAGDAGLAALVSESPFDEVIHAAGLEVSRLDRERWPSTGAAPSPSPTRWDDDAFLCYTSGTTGRPKGAVLTHANLLWTSIDTIHAHDLGATDIMYAPLPLCFTGGLVNVAMTMVHCGGTLVLETGFDPGRALAAIEEQQVTAFFAVPLLFDAMRQHPRWPTADLSSLRVAKAGGAPVAPALLEAYQERGIVLTQGYGLTEGGGSNLSLPERDAHRKLGSAGLPTFYGDVKIADEQGSEVGVGDVGEVCVTGPHIMRGYWQNDAATREAFQDGWLRTGDLGVRDDEGYVTIVDRKKDMIISGGLNVYPAEVEAALQGLEGLAEAAVIGVPSERWGEEVLAILVPTAGAEIDEEAVRARLRAQLADYKRPKRLVVRTEPLPRTVSGKVRKPDLREHYGAA